MVRPSVVVKLPHVLLEVEIPAEPFSAHFARVWLLVVVRVHMESQIIHLVEGLVANAALVGLFPTVCKLVVLVVAFLVEAFAAIFTHPRFVPGVDSDVCVEGRAAVEGLATCMAFMRFLLRVNDFVATEGAGLSKALPADLTHEGPGSCVNGHVSG